MKAEVLIVGGGAAGVFAAIRAAELRPDARVILLEAQSSLLGKLRISGGGRCNVTHDCRSPEELIRFYPRGGKELLGAFHRFGVNESIEWFQSRGVQLKTEDDGRMFPTTDDSATIVDCLMAELQRYKVLIKTSSSVSLIQKKASTFFVEARSGGYEAPTVFLATGGNRSAYSLVERLGHRIVPPVPSLFSFVIKDPLLEGLSGLSFLRVSAQLKLGSRVFTQTDPMLITHWGLSGPLIIRLSAWAARELYEKKYQADLVLNFFPGETKSQVLEKLVSLKEMEAARMIKNSSHFHLPKRFWLRLIQGLKIDEKRWAEISKKEMNALTEKLSQLVLRIEGKGSFKEEFVTCGGVDRSELDFRTMESRVVPRLFLGGEVLDVDGITGGFNFQFAWTSGYLAGTAISQS